MATKWPSHIKTVVCFDNLPAFQLIAMMHFPANPKVFPASESHYRAQVFSPAFFTSPNSTPSFRSTPFLQSCSFAFPKLLPFLQLLPLSLTWFRPFLPAPPLYLFHAPPFHFSLASLFPAVLSPQPNAVQAHLKPLPFFPEAHSSV